MQQQLNEIILRLDSIGQRTAGNDRESLTLELYLHYFCSPKNENHLKFSVKATQCSDAANVYE